MRRVPLRDFAPPPPGRSPAASTVRNRQRLQPFPYWLPFCPVRPPIPRDNRQHLHGNKRPQNAPFPHRQQEPFRPFLSGSFNSLFTPFFRCKKFNFFRSLNVSPIVAQSPDENPLFTVSKNSGNSPFLVYCNNCKNSLFNGSGKSGKSNPAGWHFSASACGISSAPVALGGY